eukprot:1142255-Pelagomonas_calceolata.AAC.2
MLRSVLERSCQMQMSSVRQYVSRQLAREMSEAARDREAVTKLSSETQGLRAELHKLKSETPGRSETRGLKAEARKLKSEVRQPPQGCSSEVLKKHS